MNSYNGFMFGFIDNLIVAIFSILGITLDKYYNNLGVYAGLYGALIGHTISDMFAGYLDFGYNVALNMGLGCLTVIGLVYIYLQFTSTHLQ
jgi:hypothetical protein